MKIRHEVDATTLSKKKLKAAAVAAVAAAAITAGSVAPMTAGVSAIKMRHDGGAMRAPGSTR